MDLSHESNPPEKVFTYVKMNQLDTPHRCCLVWTKGEGGQASLRAPNQLAKTSLVSLVYPAAEHGFTFLPHRSMGSLLATAKGTKGTLTNMIANKDFLD